MTDELIDLRVELKKNNLCIAISSKIKEKELDSKISEIIFSLENNKKNIERVFEREDIPSIEDSKVSKTKKESTNEGEDPMINISRRTGVPIEKVLGNNLFGFKNNKPQLFDPSKFRSANTALRALIFLFEIGLEKGSVSRDELSESYQLSKIKGRKVHQILNDFKKTSVIDVGRYNADNNDISLSAKGTQEAIIELKYLLIGK